VFRRRVAARLGKIPLHVAARFYESGLEERSLVARELNREVCLQTINDPGSSNRQCVCVEQPGIELNVQVHEDVDSVLMTLTMSTR
jgi:hypothetical protein